MDFAQLVDEYAVWHEVCGRSSHTVVRERFVREDCDALFISADGHRLSRCGDPCDQASWSAGGHSTVAPAPVTSLGGCRSDHERRKPVRTEANPGPYTAQHDGWIHGLCPAALSCTAQAIQPNDASQRAAGGSGTKQGCQSYSYERARYDAAAATGSVSRLRSGSAARGSPILPNRIAARSAVIGSGCRSARMSSVT